MPLKRPPPVPLEKQQSTCQNGVKGGPVALIVVIDVSNKMWLLTMEGGRRFNAPGTCKDVPKVALGALVNNMTVFTCF
eukprot:5619923-Amphidinium_carterae.1